MDERPAERLSDRSAGPDRNRHSGRLWHRIRVDPYPVLAVVTVATLCLLVAVAGAVGVWAQLNNNWESFFLMEQLFAGLTPIIVGVGAVALLASLGAVLRIG